MEERFIVSFIHCFFIAFGVIVGGSLIGSIGSFLTGDAPMTAINRIAKGLRIWAVVAAIGGTFDAIENIDKGIFGDGQPIEVFKQVLLILSAMGGVKAGLILLGWFIQEEVT
ncbi:YtrH family sporulation protein [Oceanobacillus halotolerans]|uniref:YtrH family sporulation protein n=1 Tax=Oceanobacillus halotolerans TaxID=2663380 RepID=UPI0013DBD278|nr:YtrH family sporulation protein [Oceanobacillus halotolerans]